MPELPEVETTMRELAPRLRGRAIRSAQVRWPRTIAAPAPDEFVATVAGLRFETFDRRGKYMLFGMARDDQSHSRELPPTHWLFIHLRMTGRIDFSHPGQPADVHTHVILELDDGSDLRFRDPRKFGRIWLVGDPQVVIGHLGPEPFDPNFSAQALAQRLSGRRAAVKALLLDQSIVAGVGNIYADEALFEARLHPSRPGVSLSPDEVARLHAAIRLVLAQAILRGGSSLGSSSTNYVRPGGDAGGYQEEHRVFRRTGQPCPNCATAIQRLRVAQRSTHFCPSCQPE
jgi:formamidopyrimidine-DNA glycosylase